MNAVESPVISPSPSFACTPGTRPALAQSALSIWATPRQIAPESTAELKFADRNCRLTPPPSRTASLTR